jgi:hypothetical protein
VNPKALALAVVAALHIHANRNQQDATGSLPGFPVWWIIVTGCSVLLALSQALRRDLGGFRRLPYQSFISILERLHLIGIA